MNDIGENQTSGGRNILIVDDDPVTCKLLNQLFLRNGYQVTTVYSGEEALGRIEKGTPDILVLDIMMPDMDGWEVYHRVRTVSDIPVVFLTALHSGEDAAQALRLGAQDFIRKPFHPEELLARVEAVLRLGRRPSFYDTSAADGIMTSFIRPSVSVVIPTLNEAENLPLVLPYLPMDWISEVILVDGRSTDRTVEEARRLLPSIKVILEKKPGKGAALQAGFRAASGEIITVMDADGSHDPREIPRFVKALIEGADFVKGSRFTSGGGTTDMPRIRKFGNGAFVHLVNLLFNTKFTDLCYGYHAFWRYCLDTIDLTHINGFEIDTAIYLRALNRRLRMIEVPSFEGYRFYGVGKLKTIPDGLRVLKTIAREWTASMVSDGSPDYIGFRGTSPVHTRLVMKLRREDLWDL